MKIIVSQITALVVLSLGGCQGFRQNDGARQRIDTPVSAPVAAPVLAVAAADAPGIVPVAARRRWTEFLKFQPVERTVAAAPVVEASPPPLPVVVAPPPLPVPSAGPEPERTPTAAAAPGRERYVLGVIGAIEPAYLPPLAAPFPARIDTGAATSSLDARNIRQFERDGKRWVSFDVINRDTGEIQNFKRRVVRRLRITRTDGFERRVSVMMTIQLGQERIQAEFTLNDRNDFDYPLLIGRNILAGLAVVDVNMKNTLK